MDSSASSSYLPVTSHSECRLQQQDSTDENSQQRKSAADSMLSLGLTGDENALSNFQPISPSSGAINEKLGSIQFSLHYNHLQSTLTLRIIKASDLVAKDFSGTSDPYVKIMLLPDKKRKLATNIKRKNLNPRWNETFAFEGYPYHKLMNRTLYLQVMDYDRFSRDDPIGEVCVPLNDIDLSNNQAIWRDLQPCKGHTGKLGELFIGLCYQPTHGQITVFVNSARQLKAKDINGLSDPYVKIWLTHDGKRVEKKKTVVIEKCLNPTFNESFVFDVPYEKIRQTSLVVSVMDYDRMGRNEKIGQVVLGSKSGPMEVKHWNEMFQKARQPVYQWHILKDFG
ncbi:synaptotagmin 7a [Helobdella robusta]|uniref:Synaptotagmin-7 n=1 Tax=Helobdella robusta TaxID=6412 RepID=T1FYN2_HELRO|nr:synaptotagmin 7a [Helobdella robusta]ESN99022.1 synaptotagmin 7a [Helobdella robusta]